MKFFVLIALCVTFKASKQQTRPACYCLPGYNKVLDLNQERCQRFNQVIPCLPTSPYPSPVRPPVPRPSIPLGSVWVSGMWHKMVKLQHIGQLNDPKVTLLRIGGVWYSLHSQYNANWKPRPINVYQAANISANNWRPPNRAFAPQMRPAPNTQNRLIPNRQQLPLIPPPPPPPQFSPYNKWTFQQRPAVLIGGVWYQPLRPQNVNFNNNSNIRPFARIQDELSSVNTTTISNTTSELDAKNFTDSRPTPEVDAKNGTDSSPTAELDTKNGTDSSPTSELDTKNGGTDSSPTPELDTKNAGTDSSPTPEADPTTVSIIVNGIPYKLLDEDDDQIKDPNLDKLLSFNGLWYKPGDLNDPLYQDISSLTNAICNGLTTNTSSSSSAAVADQKNDTLQVNVDGNNNGVNVNTTSTTQGELVKLTNYSLNDLELHSKPTKSSTDSTVEVTNDDDVGDFVFENGHWMLQKPVKN